MDDVGRLHEADDIRTLASVLTEVHRQNRIERLLAKLDFAEAMNAAIVGSQPDPKHRNQASFSRWLRGVEREIAKLQGQQLPTLWERLRKSRRIGR